MPRIKPNYNFEKVDIFLRVKGRLPNKKGDVLTQEILDEYKKKYEAGELVKGVVDLEWMNTLIISGTIKAEN